MLAIKQAVALRDDVVEYWLLMARIDLKADDRAGAFTAYQYVFQLDRGNIEALQALCQLGLSVGRPNDVDTYADQLLLMTPNAAAPLTAKGSAALMRGDTASANSFADRVLTQDPQNINALILKARVLAAGNKFADAAALIEATPTTPANASAKLAFLKQAYIQAHNRPAYQQTLKLLADAAPDDADAQYAYADMLYQNGQSELARSVIWKIVKAHPANFKVAAQALDVWMNAGPQALDPGRMVAEAAGLPALAKADYAQFANETGHPELALAILPGADQGEPTPDNANAKAAYAYALGMTGHMAEAMAQLNAILKGGQDPNQPWALLARARLFAKTHDYVDAIRDARLLVVNDPKNATARLALADILQASGSPDLSEIALREGLRALPDNTRLASRLAERLAAKGHPDLAAAVARDLFRTAPMDLRAQHLAEHYGAATTA